MWFALWRFKAGSRDWGQQLGGPCQIQMRTGKRAIRDQTGTGCMVIQHRIPETGCICDQYLRQAGFAIKELYAPKAAGSERRGWCRSSHPRHFDLVSDPGTSNVAPASGRVSKPQAYAACARAIICLI